MELAMHISTDGNRTANLLHIYSSVKVSFSFSHIICTWFSFDCSHASAAPLCFPPYTVSIHLISLKKRIYFITLCECVFCLHACMCTMCMYLQKVEDAIRSFGTGVADGWKPSDVGARNQTQVLCESATCLNVELPIFPIYLFVCLF